MTYWRDTRPEPPTWEEIDSFKSQLLAKVDQYLAAHPIHDEKTKFWFRHLQVVRGMTRQDVRFLLGEPVEIIRDQDKLQQAAKQFWHELRGRVQEAWVYEGVRHPPYTLFFDEKELIDIVKTSRVPL